MVTIICLCYNQAPYVSSALASVLAQSYADWELLIVDDASTDNSAETILAYLASQATKGYTQPITFIQNKVNQGNCKSFNLAYRQASGDYVIDLAGDDVLLPERVGKQVALFQTLPADYGVIFSNANHVNEQGEILHIHHKPNEFVPTGEVYEAVLKQYFICTPTMMMRRQVLDELGGYDETLSFEDFDFWVRSAKKYKYHYQNEVTTLKRKVKNSLSAQFYRTKQNVHLQSTLKVLEKALAYNETAGEHKALQVCVAYHLRQAFFTQNFDLVKKYETLWRKIPTATFPRWLLVIGLLSKVRIKVFWLYKRYLKWRF